MSALKTYQKGSPVLTTAILFSFLGYFYFGNFLERSSFLELIGIFVSLFGLAYLLIERLGLKFWTLVSLGILFRLMFIVATPNLSQDFYRFIWDGRLIMEGINPYLYTVKEILDWQQIPIYDAQTLYEGMGSLNAGNYSNYPPLNQFFFAIAVFVGGKSITATVVSMRVLLILADVGILWIGKKILDYLKLNTKTIFWYFFNPFIIIELTGNLHFEGAMLFFFLAGIYLLIKQKWVWAGVLIGLSISVKLIPLMLLPLFFRWFVPKWKINANWLNVIGFYVVTLAVFALSFVPFLSDGFADNFGQSIALWFQKFEFNASVYYIIRWIGYQTIGWNIIADVGKILPIIIIAFLCLMGLFRKINNPVDLFTGLLLGVSFYFLLSTTVHPWYIATPLLLSLFTRYRFALVWSLMVFLSYSAYGADGFHENLYLVATEYIVVLTVFVLDLKRIHQFPKYEIESRDET